MAEELEVADRTWQANLRRGLVGLLIGDDLLNVHGRRYRVDRQVRRIDDADAPDVYEPQATVGRPADPRGEPDLQGTGSHAVGCVEDSLSPDEDAIAVLLPDDLVLPTGVLETMSKVRAKRGGTVLCAIEVEPDE